MSHSVPFFSMPSQQQNRSHFLGTDIRFNRNINNAIPSSSCVPTFIVPLTANKASTISDNNFSSFSSVFAPRRSKFCPRVNSAPRTMPKQPPTARVVFSDLDGTLVHYPGQFSSYADVVYADSITGRATIRYRSSGDERTCLPLNSKTGGVAYISERTDMLIQKLRSLGVTFVIITGARASTYSNRRPTLPKSDFEFFENGGRKLIDGKLDHSWSDSFVDAVGPIPHLSDYAPSNMTDAESRVGTLWDTYRELKENGWVVDARDYTTNIRVDVRKSEGKTENMFKDYVNSKVIPRSLASSYNLGKADIYPSASGKANAARHILEELNVDAKDAVALFDDDNDIELGMLCGASFLPGITHQSVLDAKKDNPWTVMKRQGFLGTEDALEVVIKLRERAMKEGRDNK